MKRMTLVMAAVLGALYAVAGNRDGASMGALMRMELARQVVAEAQKMSALPEVGVAAERFREQMLSHARVELVAAFEDADTAQKSFAAFVDSVQAKPADYAPLRAEVAKGTLASDVASAGKFLGDVQSWLRLKDKGEVPPLASWLARDEKVAETARERLVSDGSAVAKPKKKKKRNSLRDAEAEPGTFVEAPDDGGSVLGTFDAARKARRQKALKDAEAGMSQVSSERRIADEEYNAKKQAAAAAEAAAMQAHAQKLAAAEQEAVVQDQNSWKTRVKSIVASAAGAAGAAFLGNVGSRIGEEAARSLFDQPGRR